jgi:hypothetical protein
MLTLTVCFDRPLASERENGSLLAIHLACRSVHRHSSPENKKKLEKLKKEWPSHDINSRGLRIRPTFYKSVRKG